MSIKAVQTQLLKCSKKLSELESFVDSQKHINDMSLQIPIFFTRGFDFTGNKAASKQEQTIVNGAEDAIITSISYSVQSVQNIDFPPPVDTLEQLYLRPVFEIEQGFEFRWNYRLASTQARYLSQSNTVSMASRRSLGYAEVANVLELAKPLKFVAGDAISLEVEPVLNNTATPIPNPAGDCKGYLLFMTLRGFRNGVMA
jgi:hypothetical protein